MKRLNRIYTWILAVAAVWAAAASGAASLQAAAAPPNDPHYDKQSYLNQIGVPAAWESIASTGKALEPVTVAVIDTGVDLNHPDLLGRLVEGVNILQPKRPPQDDNGHGTAVAGVIAAAAGNGEGIAGIAPNARIMPIKAIDAKGVGEEEHLGQGIEYAVGHGADIIVLSLGLHLYSPYLSQIVDDAESKGVLLVAATGNEGKTVRYPAAYPSVVAVGGASHTNEHKDLSNYGPEVDLLAPWYVYTTWLKGKYVTKEGTSMAAPQTAAVAALLLGLEPSLTPGDIRERLRQSALPLGSGWNERTGYGLLRADAAIALTPKADAFEPNDRKEQAKPTSTVGLVRGELTTGTDEDWFAFDPPYPGEIGVTLRGAPANAELLVSQGGRSRVRYDLSNGAKVRLPAPDGERLYAALRLKAGAAGPARYELETSFHIYTDPYEPNDKAYQSFRLPAKSSNVIEGTFSKIDDQDWFALPVDAPGTVSLRLESDTLRIEQELYFIRDGDAAGQLFNNDKKQEGKPLYSGNLDVKPGLYYIRVENIKAVYPLPVAGEYKLTIEFERKLPDVFEPNNRSYQATTMAAEKQYNGVFNSAKDEDWFQIRVSRRSLVTIDLTGIPLDRYLYYTLYNSNTQQEYGKTSPFGSTTMRLRHDLEPGVYYIRLMTDAAFQDKQYGITLHRAPLVAGFVDLDRHWAADSVKELVAKGVVAGYGDYRFRPSGSLTRAEAAAMLTRAFGWKASAGARAFPDVPRTHWASGSVQAAAEQGVVRGYPDGAFRPNEPVTRAEMAVMAALAAGKAVSTPAKDVFADVPRNHWAAPHIAEFSADGRLLGFKDGSFRPSANATRAEFATLLARIMN